MSETNPTGPPSPNDPSLGSSSSTAGAEQSPLDPVLLAMLRCPHTGKTLRMASSDEVAAINDRVAAGSCVDATGEPVTAPLESGLVAEGGEWLYPIRDAIPTLIPEEAIPHAGR